MTTSIGISDAEWQVMRAIWEIDADGEVMSRQIISRLKESTDWTSGTIKTLLHRLVEKEILDFRRKGNRYLYRSNFSHRECVDWASSQLLHTAFAGRPVKMLSYLVETTRLSGKEIETLTELLRQLRQELPPQTPRREVHDTDELGRTVRLRESHRNS